MSLIVLKAFLRRKKVVIGISIGIMLAFSFIISTFLSADYVGSVNLRRYLDLRDVDYCYDIILNQVDYIDDIGSTLKNDSYVLDYLVMKNFIPTLIYNSSLEYIPVNIFGINKFSKTFGLRIIQGDENLTSGIAIPQTFASKYGVGIGSKINLTMYYYSPSEGKINNVTIQLDVKSIFVLSSSDLWSLLKSEFWYYGLPWEIEELMNYEESYAFLTSFDLIYSLLDEYNKFLHYSYYERNLVKVIVKVDKDKLVAAWDIENSIKRVNGHYSALSKKLSMFGAIEYSNNYLSERLSSVTLNLSFIRLSLSFFIIPVLLIGLLLTGMTNWLTVTTRSREISLFKIRGVKIGSILNSLILESGLSGVIGGITGVLLGGLLYIILVNTYMGEYIHLVDPAKLFYAHLGGYMLWGAMIGGIIAVLISVIMTRRLSKLKVSEVLTDHIEQIEKELKFSKLDFFFAITGVYSILELASGFWVMRTIFQMAMRNFALMIFIMFFIFFEQIAIFAGPFFFVYEASKFIASRVQKFKKVLSTILDPFLKDLKEIAIKNFSRNPMRAARLIVILSITVSFTIFYPILAQTMETRENIDIIFQNGSDIRINVYNMNYTTAIDIKNRLENITGVRDAYFNSEIQWGSSTISSINILCVDPEYFTMKYYKQSYLEGISLEEASKELNKSYNIIFSKSVLKKIDIKPGKNITLRIDVYGIIKEEDNKSPIIEFKVLGLAKFLPGLTYSMFYPQTEEPIILMSYQVFKKIFNKTLEVYSIHVNIEKGANVTLIKETINSILLNDYGIDAEITTLDDLKEQRQLYGFTMILPMITQFEVILTAFISIAAISLAAAVTISERRKEIALLYTRGFSKEQLYLIIIAEGLITSIIAFLIGIITSLAYTMGLLVSIMTYAFGFTLSVEFPEGYLISVPLYLTPYLISLFLIFTLAPIIPLYILFRKRFVEELRVRH